MSRTRSERPRVAGIFGVALLGAAVALTPCVAWAQSHATGSQDHLLSSVVEVSRRAASIKLQFTDDRSAEFAIRDGHVFTGGAEIGQVDPGSALDTSWRNLLNRLMNAPAEDIERTLLGWTPPDAAPGRDLDTALKAVLQGKGLPTRAAEAAPTTEATDEASSSDSVSRLLGRIQQLQRQVNDLEESAVTRVDMRAVPPRGFDWLAPFRRIVRGVLRMLSLLVGYAVLFGIGFGVIFFGGRKYMEGVADTARKATTRSLLVGLAASFLIVPAFILGIIALAISIVGIPALLLWIPVFPLALCAAVLFGYLGVAHAAGEALAERRFYASEWFKRANSYYFLATGLSLLVVLFLAGQVLSIAPFMGFFAALLKVLGVVATWAALTIGLGAVLLSRAGTRPLGSSPPMAEPEIFAEETHV